MAAQSQALRQLEWDAAAIEAMRPVLDVTPWAGFDSLQSALGGAHLIEFTQGRQRALLALRGVQCEGGRVLEVVGLRSLGDRLQALPVCQALEHLAVTTYRADLLTMTTRRPHLVRACERAGWVPVATVMNKHLGAH